MTKTTQKQIIESFKQMKEIKPRKEWAVLLKSQILSEQNSEPIQAQSSGFISAINSIFAQRKLVYSLAAILFLVIGVFGFAKYTVPGDLLFPVKKIAEQSQAALSGHTGIKQDVVILSTRINDLVQVAKEGRTDNIPSAISEVNANAKDLAQSLKNNPVNDPTTIKDIANSLKTLADVPGADLTSNQNVKDLYQAVVQSQITDLKKVTLTNAQSNMLLQVEDLYSQGKYADALVLLMSN